MLVQRTESQFRAGNDEEATILQNGRFHILGKLKNGAQFVAGRTRFGLHGLKPMLRLVNCVPREILRPFSKVFSKYGIFVRRSKFAEQFGM